MVLEMMMMNDNIDIDEDKKDILKRGFWLVECRACPIFVSYCML